jgi:hypothetical protein
MSQMIVTLVLLAFFLKVDAQTCSQKAPPADVKKMQSLVGEWRGEFTADRKTHSVAFVFYEENQELKVKISNNAFALAAVQADASLCSIDKFHFFGRGVAGEVFTYNARLVNGELLGDYKIGESCSKENRSSFKLQKVKT